jgi:ribosomal protein S18 acetylase RimI-like enzyme
MKELYVKPQWLSQKLGEQLLGEVYNHARQTGAARVQWTVLKTNERAKLFYARNGGEADGVWELWGSGQGAL